MRHSLILFLVLAAAGCVAPYEPPKPVPVSTAKAVFADYQRRYAATLAGVADRLERGDITTAQQAADEIQAGIQAARIAAFQPMGDRMNAAVGMERWDVAKAAAVLRQMSQEITVKGAP